MVRILPSRSFRPCSPIAILVLLVAGHTYSSPVIKLSLNSPYGDRSSPSFSQLKDLLAEQWNTVEDQVNSVLPFSEDAEILEQFKRLLLPQQPERNWTDCEKCTTLVDALRFLLDRFSFEELQKLVTRICYTLIGSTQPNLEEIRKEELCNGTIATQGPHVAEVVKSTSPKRFCEFQNLCFKKTSSSKQRRSSRQSEETKDKRPKDKHQRPAPTTDSSFKIVQLTDIHVDIRYAQGSLADCGLPMCCLEEYGKGSAGPYGDYNCDTPPRTIELFLKKIAEFMRTSDFAIYTGDISGSRLWDETQEEILNISSTLISLISKNIPNVTVYPAFGNHEMFPTNLFYKGNSDLVYLTNQVTDWWTPVARFQDDQIQTMKSAGYYSIEVRPGLQLLCYNSNYMYTRDFYNVINTDNRTEVHEMVDFVENELEKAKSDGKKVILIGHHPPSSADYLVEYGHWYHQLILKYADIIVLQPTGHKHADHFNLVPDLETGTPKSIVYISAAVTPGGRKNPSMRIYHLDSTTFSTLDYDQYQFDLSSVTGNTEPEIVKLYSAREEYSLPDLSPNSWSAFVDRLETDDALLLKHMSHRTGDAQNVTSCDEGCKLKHICSLRTITYDSYLNCLDTYQLKEASAASLPSYGSFALATLLLVVMLVTQAKYEL